MNRYIIHIAYLCLTLFLLASCNKQEDAMPQDEGMVTLSISAAMASRTTDTGDVNRTYAELMHTLRIIIFDGNGNVEHNRLYEFEKGLFDTENHIFIVKANETKTIYLLANCEKFAVKEDDLTIASLDALELEGDGILQNQDTKPDKGEGTINVLPATAKYSIQVEEKSQTETLYVVHAANKIQFEFINNTGEEIELNSWTLYSLAPKSYLIPRVNDTNWLDKVRTPDETKNVITNYDVPVEPDEHEEYTYTYTTPLQIPVTTDETSDAVITPADNETPIYLHESKFSVPAEAVEGEVEEWADEQQYTITFRISKQGESDSKPYTAALTNLPSLFRGTYVKVKVTINELEEGEGKDGIYAEIFPWKEQEPVNGDLEPVEESN